MAETEAKPNDNATTAETTKNGRDARWLIVDPVVAFEVVVVVVVVLASFHPFFFA